MFVQVIQARAKDKDAVKAELERWHAEIAPSAEGWLGSTGGVTPDGQFLGVARFESQEAAQAQSNSPEQDRWWKGFSQHLEGEASFFDSSGVTLGGQGGSDNAGFVQVMQGKVNDIEKAKEMDARMEQDMPQRRPDVIGNVTAYKEDGTFYSVLYFTSLEEARQGEKQMTENPPPEMEEWGQLMEGEMKFFDLEEPWLSSK
jgi:hypothetical protein